VIIRPRRSLRALLLFLFGFNAAVGSSLAFRPFYVVSGISWIDVLVMVTFFGLIHFRETGPSLSATRVEIVHAGLVVALSLWLMASTILNGFEYGMETGDLLPPLRLFYFLVLMHVTRTLVGRYGSPRLIAGFIGGVLVLAVSELAMSDRVILGLPLLVNPNVTGALLGVGAWFAALSMILGGGIVLNMLAVIVLTALSITSFSKGAWLMCGCAVALFATVAIARRAPRRRLRIWQRAIVGITVLAILVGTTVFVSANMDRIVQTFALKLETTTSSGSASLRADLAVASWYAGLDHPVFGLGYRNFYQTQFLYPELHLPPLERVDNAHNLFAQTLAVGGFPAAAMLILAVMLPMLVLWRKLQDAIRSPLARTLSWSLSLAVWVIYGSVQLQLIAQPPFWFFCGVVFGLKVPARRHA
jgi:hypothetical protein